MSRTWTAIKGAKRWAEAWARGDRASAEVVARRIDQCRRCPTLVVGRVPVLGFFAATCGRPGEESATNCGCVMGWVPADQAREMERSVGGDRGKLGALVRKHMRPCAAATVGTKGCIQGRFPPVEVRVRGEAMQVSGGGCRGC